MKIKHSLAGLLTITTLLFTAFANAGVDTETNENGVILAGYDTVAYFTENAAVQGSADFTATHNGAIYYFSSAENRDQFNQAPSQYAPQFGGFCAYGAALGKKFAVNGKAFEVVDNKLYVNKNEDVYDVWIEDKEDNIVAADTQWSSIKDVAADEL